MIINLNYLTKIELTPGGFIGSRNSCFIDNTNRIYLKDDCAEQIGYIKDGEKIFFNPYYTKDNNVYESLRIDMYLKNNRIPQSFIKTDYKNIIYLEETLAAWINTKIMYKSPIISDNELIEKILKIITYDNK